jgi:predicted DNA-binding transcriptional regulator AlpA
MSAHQRRAQRSAPASSHVGKTAVLPPRGPSANDASATTLVRLPAVLLRLSIGRTKLYEMIAKQQLPQPVKLGRASAWRTDELDAAITRLSNARQRPPEVAGG